MSICSTALPSYPEDSKSNTLRLSFLFFFFCLVPMIPDNDSVVSVMCLHETTRLLKQKEEMRISVRREYIALLSDVSLSNCCSTLWVTTRRASQSAVNKIKVSERTAPPIFMYTFPSSRLHSNAFPLHLLPPNLDVLQEAEHVTTHAQVHGVCSCRPRHRWFV